MLAAVEVAHTRRERTRGLLGRDGFTGAFVIRRCRQVHTLGMRFDLDVAFCDAEGVVLRIATLKRWRVSPLVWRSAFVIEAESGAFERWGMRVGDRVEVKE